MIFRKKLSTDILNNIVKSDKLLVPTDKTSNFYRMDTTSYIDLLQINITKTYKKVTQGTTSSIEPEAKAIAKKQHLDDRTNTTAQREAFIILKDHKLNFPNNPPCRLINPVKAEISQISKQLLDRINTRLEYRVSSLQSRVSSCESRKLMSLSFD